MLPEPGGRYAFLFGEGYGELRQPFKVESIGYFRYAHVGGGKKLFSPEVTQVLLIEGRRQTGIGLERTPEP